MLTRAVGSAGLGLGAGDAAPTPGAQPSQCGPGNHSQLGAGEVTLQMEVKYLQHSH